MFDLATDWAISVAVVLPRMAMAFIILPLFTSESMPALARNSFFVALAIAVVPLAGAQEIQLSAAEVFPILLKEMFIGAMLGFSFSALFWAISVAGGFLDNVVGMGFTAVVDPVQGGQRTLFAQFFGQFANWVFMASGAFIIFLDALLGSYLMWPVGDMSLKLGPEGFTFMAQHFGYLMTFAFVISAPLIVTVMLVDVVFGLLNRYAQQLQVFTMSIPTKVLVSAWLMMLFLGVLVEHLVKAMGENRDILDKLAPLF